MWKLIGIELRIQLLIVPVIVINGRIIGKIGTEMMHNRVEINRKAGELQTAKSASTA